MNRSRLVKMTKQMVTTTITGHRRLLEHLADPTCPSIRQFIEKFPLYEGEEQGKEELGACSSLPEGNGSRGTNGDANDHSTTAEKTQGGGEAMCDDEWSRNDSDVTRNGSAVTGRACANDSKIGGVGHASGGGDRGEGVDADLMAGDGIVGSPTATALREAYNGCLGALGDFR